MLEYVVKADGSQEKFDKEKLMQTAIRAGASKEMAITIAVNAEKNFPSNAGTHEIYQFVMNELDKKSEKVASLFGLREAIADLDATVFEKYTAKILEANGYECKWNTIVDGRNIDHQIDVIAYNKKTDEYFYVECKRHYNPHRFCGLEVPLEVQARLEDLREGFIDHKNKYNFAAAWIFTNSKFSEHARKYATRKGVMITGWSTENNSIQELIEKQKVYPVTILKIDLGLKASLLNSGIITLQDVINSKKSPKEAVDKAKEILGKN